MVGFKPAKCALRASRYRDDTNSELPAARPLEKISGSTVAANFSLHYSPLSREAPHVSTPISLALKPRATRVTPQITETQFGFVKILYSHTTEDTPANSFRRNSRENIYARRFDCSEAKSRSPDKLISFFFKWHFLCMTRYGIYYKKNYSLAIYWNIFSPSNRYQLFVQNCAFNWPDQTRQFLCQVLFPVTENPYFSLTRYAHIERNKQSSPKLGRQTNWKGGVPRENPLNLPIGMYTKDRMSTGPFAGFA